MNTYQRYRSISPTLAVLAGSLWLAITPTVTAGATPWEELDYGVQGHMEGRTYTTDPFSADIGPLASAREWAFHTSVGVPRGEATDVWFFADLSTGTLSALSASASAFCPADECGIPNWSTYSARSSTWARMKDTLTFTLPPGEYADGVTVALSGVVSGYVGSQGDTAAAAASNYWMQFRDLQGGGIATASVPCIFVTAGDAVAVFDPFVLSFDLLPDDTTLASATTRDTLAEFHLGQACGVSAIAASVHVKGIANAETVPGIRVESLSISDPRVSWHSASGVFLDQMFTDSDGDGLPDNADNCVAVDNPRQRDADGDGIGNACDADLNNDCFVNGLDLGALKTAYFSADAVADLNGDGAVNAVDLGIMRTWFFSDYTDDNPSGIANLCSLL